MYQIELRKAELSALAWIAGRYHYAAVLYDAIKLTDIPHTWELAESDAWEFAAAVDAEDGFLSCAGEPLADKMLDLLNAIV